MFLHFPNLDTLRLALTSGAIPETVRSSAARFGFDDTSVWVQPSDELSEKSQKDLRRLGIQIPDASTIPLNQTAADWLQIFPLTRDPRAGDVGEKTPVLFELTKPSQLAEVALEILRLGNDRQSFRWLDENGASKVLLRVIGPPYYSLLRAMDRAGEDGAPFAYREVSPSIWIQVGYTHPLAEHLKPPPGQWLLLRAPHEWTYVPEAKLRDIYEVIDFQLPEASTVWSEINEPARIAAPVRLTRSGAAEPAELWVLREAGIGQLEELVRTSDNELLARLAFAVGEKDGNRLVVLRVRPSKSAPPVLVLDGLAYRSYLRIPNLFLPVGTVLHPPLRRDAVVKLLAEDRARLTWLTPSPNGSFTPESLPDDVLRPLSEWVDYVLEHEHQAIKSWLGATQFQFESFICKDDIAREMKPPRDAAPKAPRMSEPVDADMPNKPIDVVEKQKAKKPDSYSAETEEVKPGELENRLRELEESYNALKTPLEDPGRQSMWQEMARLNGALNQHSDAAVCWGNALWEEANVKPDWPRDWYRLEAKQPVGAAPALAQVLRHVNADPTTHANVRLVTASLLWAAALPSPSPDLRPHLGKIQQFLLKHEAYLGVRLSWLAWHAFHQLSGADVLTLARARDRLLERLHLHGLTPELDLPGFLRFTGLQANTRFRLVRDQVVRLQKHVQEWARAGKNPIPETRAYIDLIFAFGLARLGEATEARNLLREAGAVLASADEVHSWLYEAFEYRVQQALDGKPALDRLSTSLLERLEAVEHPDYLKNLDAGEDVKQKLRHMRLKIERLRTSSRILEPLERLDAYRRWLRPAADELKRALIEMTDLPDRDELIQRFAQMFSGKRKFKGATKTDPRILSAALELAPRLGQAFGEETLDRVHIQLAKLTDAEKIASLLEKSVLLAAHCDRKEDVQRFVDQLHALLQDAKALPLEHLIPLVTGSFRALRKFGLRDAALQLLQRLGAIVQAERNVQTRSASSLVSDRRSKFHCLLLELAGGWFFFGEEDRARKILDEARALLLANELYYTHQTDLACAYLTALGQAPMEFALARIMEFFRRVEGVYDVWTTQSHFSLTRLNVVEAMMLAIISDDFTLDPSARRRLDDDEFLVRRRIHRDVRDALGRSGL